MSKPTADDACVVAFATNPACARAAKKAGADVVFVAALNYRRGEACCEGRIVDEEQPQLAVDLVVGFQCFGAVGHAVML